MASATCSRATPPLARDFLVIPERGRWSLYWGKPKDIAAGNLVRLALIHAFWRRSVAEHLRDHLQLAYDAGRNEHILNG